jgi:hypothetical protein
LFDGGSGHVEGFFLSLSLLLIFVFLPSSYADWCDDLLPTGPCETWTEAKDTQLTYYFEDMPQGTTVHDSSSNGNDGKIISAQWVSGCQGNALQFGQLYDRVLIDNTPSLSDDIAKGLKISFCLKLDPFPDCPDPHFPCFYSVVEKPDSFGVRIIKWGDLVPQYGWEFYTCDSEPLITYLFTEIGQPHQFEFTFDGGIKKLLVDGELRAYQASHASEALTDDPVDRNIPASEFPMFIGAAMDVFSVSFRGTIDSLSIYKKAKLEAYKLAIDEDNPLYFKNIFWDPGTSSWKLRDHVLLVGHGQHIELFNWKNQACLDQGVGMRCDAPGAMSALMYLKTLSDYNLNYCRTPAMSFSTWQERDLNETPIPDSGYNRVDYCGLKASDTCKLFQITSDWGQMDQGYFIDRFRCFTDYAQHSGVFIEYTLFGARGLHADWADSVWNTARVPVPPADPCSDPDPPQRNSWHDELNVPWNPPERGGTDVDEIFSGDDKTTNPGQGYQGWSASACRTLNQPERRRCFLWRMQSKLIDAIGNQVVPDYDNYIFEVCNEEDGLHSLGPQPGRFWTEQVVKDITGRFPDRLKSVDRKYFRDVGPEGNYVEWCAECMSTGSDSHLDNIYGQCDIVDVHANPRVDDLMALYGAYLIFPSLDDDPVHEKTKPRINNENYWPDGLNSIWDLKVAWASFIGGAHYFRHMGGWSTGSLQALDAELKGLEALTKFAHSTSFWRIKPDDNFLPLNSSPTLYMYHGMSNDPRNPANQDEYIVYVALPDGGHMNDGQLQLRNMPANSCFQVEWYFPEEGIGSFRPGPIIQSNELLLVPGFTDHVAIHLWKVSCR